MLKGPSIAGFSSFDDVSDWLQAMPIVRHLGVTLGSVKHGEVELQMPYDDALSFRSGALQAGAIGALIDFAGGAAVVSTLHPGGSATTFDFSIKMLAPAVGTNFVARARIASPKRSINVCLVDVIARAEDSEALCATGSVTMLVARQA